jgi:hypothetical protein
MIGVVNNAISRGAANEGIIDSRAALRRMVSSVCSPSKTVSAFYAEDLASWLPIMTITPGSFAGSFVTSAMLECRVSKILTGLHAH